MKFFLMFYKKAIENIKKYPLEVSLEAVGGLQLL